MVNILVIEAENTFLQEVISFVTKKTRCRVTNLSSHSEVTLSAKTLCFSGLEIQPKEQRVCRKGELVPMSHHEFFTLLYLAQHPGWVFTKEQIYEVVWKEPADRCGAAVTNVISQIRRKIGDGYIETVINSGYKFIG
ncbi:MAG: winged helix-turn-helix domain-containing protein [Eubacteriales bacterium]|nr:winged helix-turn-helix domain-containing protein [Eubacteriales bacterium]